MKYLRKGTEIEATSMLSDYYDNDVVILSATEDGSRDKTYINFCEADLDNPPVEFEWWFDTCRFWDDDYNTYPCVKFKFTKLDIGRIRGTEGDIAVCLEYTKTGISVNPDYKRNKCIKNKTFNVYQKCAGPFGFRCGDYADISSNIRANYFYLDEIELNTEYCILIHDYKNARQHMRIFSELKDYNTWEYRCNIRLAFRGDNGKICKIIKPENYKYFSCLYKDLISVYHW